MSLNFCAIDFETANSHPSSSCSVGLVRVRDSRITARAGWLIRPAALHSQFLPFNVKIHGITEELVADAPEWGQQLQKLTEFIADDVTVAHNASFDMRVLRESCRAAGKASPEISYMCSVQISRNTYELSSHSLPFAAAAAGFHDFNHHEALADAEAAAAIIIDAARRHGAADIRELAAAAGINIYRVQE